MKSVAIYARVSTADQITNMSLPDQVSSCRRAARSDGHNDHQIKEYVDAGVSGGKGEADRPQFGQLMADVRAGGVQAVYFLSLDRLSRDTIHTLTALADMRRYGVKIVSLRDPHLESHLVTAINAAMAQEERMRIRDRTLPRKLSKRDKGFWVIGAPPYGYRLNRTTKTLTQCANEAPILRRIFDLARQGRGRTRIARILNAADVPAPEVLGVDADGKSHRIRVGHVIDGTGLLGALSERGLRPVENAPGILIPRWKSSTVSKVLKNTMAFGSRSGVQFTIDPGPILTESEFLEVQAGMVRRRATAGAEVRSGLSTRWLLTGFLKCESCGSNYVHHESRNYHRYCCGNRRGGGTCQNPNISMETADTTTLDALRGALWSAFPTTERFREHLLTETRGRVWELQSRIKSLSAAEEIAKQERIRKEDLWAAGMKQGLSPDALAGLGARLMEATANYRKVAGECAKASRKMMELSAGMPAQEQEVGKVSDRMFSALTLVTSDGEPTTDLRGILSILLAHAFVSQAGMLVIDLHEQSSALDLMELLAAPELEYQRMVRTAGRA